MNIKVRQKEKDNFEKHICKLINNAVFGKGKKNVRKNKDINLVTKERKGNYLVTEPNYYNQFFLTESLFKW